MTGLTESVVNLLAGRLDPDEREAVLGDFLDAGVSAPRALRELSGLLARRELTLWSSCRPWLALVGVAGPLALMLWWFYLPLSNTYGLYSWIIANYPHFDRTMLEETGLTPERGIVLMLRQVLLLGLWSWTCGFVMGKFADRTVWVHGLALAVLAWWLLFWSKSGLAASALVAMLFIAGGFVAAPLAWGALRGVRREEMGLRPAVLVAIALLALVAVSEGAGQWNWVGEWRTADGALHLGLRWLLCWPTAYLVASALRAERMGETYDAT